MWVYWMTKIDRTRCVLLLTHKILRETIYTLLSQCANEQVIYYITILWSFVYLLKEIKCKRNHEQLFIKLLTQMNLAKEATFLREQYPFVGLFDTVMIDSLLPKIRLLPDFTEAGSIYRTGEACCCCCILLVSGREALLLRSLIFLSRFNIAVLCKPSDPPAARLGKEKSVQQYCVHCAAEL